MNFRDGIIKHVHGYVHTAPCHTQIVRPTQTWNGCPHMPTCILTSPLSHDLCKCWTRSVSTYGITRQELFDIVRCSQVRLTRKRRLYHIYNDMVSTAYALHMIMIFHASTKWRHQMETFSALLANCAGNSPVTGEFPAQRQVTRSFDVSFDLRLNKQ